jgi:zinc transport system ATP-binding protein
VLLARALCATQKILLLDEPAAGLDPNASADMYALIKWLNDGGTTIVMISHDIAASVKYASHILHIGQQAALFFGRTAAYLECEVGRAYAGMRGGQ